MSILRSKHSGWTWEGRRTPFGGGSGGGGGQPTQTTTYSTNIPEYARPYVENMLQSTQKQIYTDDMGGFRPYQPYSTDVNQYFAGFSPLQQRAQQATYGLQTPGQFGAATGLAGAAGAGGLSAAEQAGALGGQALGYGAAGAEYGGMGAQQALARAQQTGREAGMYGRMGAGFGRQAAGLAPTAQRFGQEAADIGMGGLGYGAMGAGYGGRGALAAEQGFGAGEAFARQATSPEATAAYMSPYMQNVVDYQKSQALRDYQIGAPMRARAAIGAGAFGGSRQAIESAEAQRNLMSQLQGIQATGTQKAFEDAQRQQQFGANLGLQGLQAGYGGLGLGMQGAGMGLQGLGTALQGQQARMAGLGQAGQFLGQGMQGAGLGLQGVGAQQAAGQLGLAGTAQGIQGAQAGLQGVGQAVGAGQYGLGGLGAATQAAGTLGQLGAQQLGAQKDIIGLQSQMGAQQQAQEQQKINQAIQDYAIAQQYPFMQLGMMNAMLRGLPLQTQTTQLYQAQPSYLQQGIGLAGAGMSLFGGRKEGGVIKMAKGGIADAIPGYKYGKLISEPKLESMADDLTIPQLQQMLKDPALTPSERQVFAERLQEKMQQEKARMSGIAMAGGPAFESQGLAGGGIVAFNGEEDSLVRGEAIDPETGEPYKTVNPVTRFGQFMSPFSGPGSFGSIARQGKSIEETYDRPRNVSPEDRTRQAQAEAQDIQEGPGVTPTAAKTEAAQTGTKGTAAAQAAETKAAAQGPNSFAKFLAEIKGAGPKGQMGAEYEKFLEDRLGKSAERLSRDERMAMAKGFLKFASTPAPGGIGQAAAAGLTEYATGVEAARKSQETMENEARKAQMELNKARRAEERGDVAAAQEAYGKYEDRMSRIQAAQISAGAAGQAGRFEREAVERVMAENPGMKFADALQIVKGAGRFESTEVQRMKAAQDALNKSIPYLKASASKKPEDQARALQIRNEIYANFGLMAPGGGIGGGQGGGGQGPGILRFDAQGNLIKG
jgi:hypothetical protein